MKTDGRTIGDSVGRDVRLVGSRTSFCLHTPALLLTGDSEMKNILGEVILFLLGLPLLWVPEQQYITRNIVPLYCGPSRHRTHMPEITSTKYYKTPLRN
jgi:hypothetical protein